MRNREDGWGDDQHNLHITWATHTGQLGNKNDHYRLQNSFQLHPLAAMRVLPSLSYNRGVSSPLSALIFPSVRQHFHYLG